jgi:hypothetical protein
MEAADVTEILQLKAQYTWALDEARTEDLIDLFVDDLLYDTTDIYPASTALTSKDDLRSFLSTVVQQPGKFHLAATPIITIDGDRATGRWRYLAGGAGWSPEKSCENHLHIDAIGSYEDEYRREAGVWKIVSTRVLGRPLVPPDIDRSS